LFLEVRDEQQRQVSFAAFDLDSRKTIFKDLTFDEHWWISLADASGDFLLLKVYTDTNNPEKKSLLVYDFKRKEIAWWRNHYSISFVADNIVQGSDHALGTKFLALDLQTGSPIESGGLIEPKENFLIQKPLQYFHDSNHFETIKRYIEGQCGVNPVSLIEYLEFEGIIAISFYMGEQNLANYLLILKEDGNQVLYERIGEQLKGIGMDTFFMFSEYLIFAKNKGELISYKMV